MVAPNQRVQQAYKPTSLEFINGPNPVEPDLVEPIAPPQKHPLNTAPRLEQAPKTSLLRVLRDSESAVRVERPVVERQASGDVHPLSLPKPPVANETRRPQLPPTLSGLHQPPPDAGLLPSIVVEQPSASVVKQPGLQEAAPRPRVAPRKPNERRLGRNKWTEDETSDLLKGVAKFGIGNWTKILNDPSYHFITRNALDLKDRFRVCCPEYYRTLPKSKNNTKQADVPAKSKRTQQRERAKAGKSALKLIELGIEEPLVRTRRRERRGYTAEEDDAIFKGYGKHGNAWTSIRDDPDFSVLSSRTATDLRDRFRTRFPEQYIQAGLTPRARTAPKIELNVMTEAEARNSTHPAAFQQKSDHAASLQQNSDHTHEISKEQTWSQRLDKERKDAAVAAKRAAIPSLFTSDDLFWSVPLYDDIEAETDRITLDRGILDWAYDELPKPYGQVETVVASSSTAQTFSIPQHPSAQVVSHQPNVQLGNGSNPGHGAALPSLATVAAGMAHDDDTEAQLELPSLILGPTKNGDKSGGQLMSVYDMLS